MYGLITKLSNLKAATRGRQQRTIFVPAIISQRGEMSYELVDFIEHATGRFKRRQRKVFDIDGRTLAQRVARFRTSFKDSLMKSLFSGVGFTNALSWGAGALSA